ncbi:MAG: enoyl-CoA hydratase/isomerase family protein [Myxococcaceae bacterium]
MDYEQISIAERDGVGTLTLNRPAKRNALSIRMREEITACLEAWKTGDAVSAVVIRGAGAGFCAGLDRDELLSDDPATRLAVYDSSKRYHRALMYFPKPVVAAIHGHALGGGFDLATLCDVRIAAEGTQLGHPEIKFGAPPFVTPLARISGEGWARDLCLSGRRIDAAEAFRIGLVTHLVSASELDARAEAVVRQILEAPLEALVSTKAFVLHDAEAWFRREHDQTFEKMYGL